MSKKHFAALAEAIRFMEVDKMTRAHIIHEIGTVCLRFNERFDRSRFEKAATPAKERV